MQNQKWGNAMPAKAHDTEASEGRLAKKQKAAQEEQTQQPTELAKNDVSSTLVDPATQPDKKRAAPGLVQPVEHSTDPLNPPDVEQATEAGWCEKDMGRGGDCFFRAYVKEENLFSPKSRANNRWPRQPCIYVSIVPSMKQHGAMMTWKSNTKGQGSLPQKASMVFFETKKSYYVNEHLIRAVAALTGTPVVIWRAYGQKVGDEQNKENNPPENQQCANLWHRGVWAPRFKQPGLQ